jgi:hypothetical protein
MTALGLLVCVLTPFLAHLAFCAALILLRADAERARFGLVAKRPPFNFPRTERVASTCLSWFTSFVLSAFNSETKDAKVLKFAIDFPSGKDVSRIARNWTAAGLFHLLRTTLLPLRLKTGWPENLQHIFRQSCRHSARDHGEKICFSKCF